jgi:hypothetical protein
MFSVFAWGLTGGKKTIVWGEGGRVIAGRCDKAESAAEEDDVDIVESVRVLSLFRLCSARSAG